jgi:predicted permease
MRFERWVYAIKMRLRSLFRREAIDRELDLELRYHVEMKTEENIAKGMTRKEARRAALVEAGGIDQAKERCRETRGVNWINDLTQDFRFGLRMLRKNPGFTAVAVLTLSLCIGANSTIFGLIDVLLLKPLPVKDPGALAFLGTRDQTGVNHVFYFESYERLQAEQSFFESLAAFSRVELNVSVDDEPEPPVPGQLVSGNYFDTVGTGAQIGRTISESDDEPATATPIAMLSYDYWQSRFQGSSEIVGSKILIDGTPFTIVGVTPRGFAGLEVGNAPKVLLPLAMQPVVMPDAENWLARPRNTVDWLTIVGRRKAGVSIKQAETGMSVVFERVQTQLASEIDPNWRATWLKQWAEARLVLEPGETGVSNLRTQFSQPLFVLMGLVTLVLFIGCANVANLLLARSAARQQEMAVRVAIGAGRGRLLRQLVSEGVLLSLVGGVFGLACAYWGTRALVAFLSSGRNPISLDLSPDVRVLGFTGLVSLGTGMLFGVAPALRTLGVDLFPVLREGGYSGTSRQRLGKVLIVSEVALSLVLVVGAGLLASSLGKLDGFDSGFPRDKVITVRLAPKGSDQKRPNAERLQGTYLQLQQNLRNLPGVVAVSLAGTSPTDALPSRTVRTQDGRPFRISWTQIYPQYFDTLGIPIIEGRDFDEFDNSTGAGLVAVINETFAQHAFPGENPIGKKIVCSGDQTCDVVGVAKDIKYPNLKSDVGDAMYMTFLQAPTGRGQMVLHVRFAGDGGRVMGQIRRLVANIDPNMPAVEIRTLQSEVDAALIRERLLALLSTILGGLAMLLSAIGLYGVVAYAAGCRAKEIGLRMALGASRHRMLWLVLGETFRLAGLGIAVGAPLSVAASRLIAGFLYGLGAADLRVLAASAVMLLAVALTAGLVPALRASSLDPMLVLRHQ